MIVDCFARTIVKIMISLVGVPLEVNEWVGLIELNEDKFLVATACFRLNLVRLVSDRARSSQFGHKLTPN